MSSQFDETVQAQEAEDDAVDIMAQREAFVALEPEGKRSLATQAADAVDEKAERHNVFAMASNASIDFPDTNSFFTFLEDARAYLATGVLPQEVTQPTDTPVEGWEAPEDLPDA